MTVIICEKCGFPIMPNGCPCYILDTSKRNLLFSLHNEQALRDAAERRATAAPKLLKGCRDALAFVVMIEPPAYLRSQWSELVISLRGAIAQATGIEGD